MDAGGCSKINEQERKGNKRVWTKEEEEALLDILDEIVVNGGHADRGSFKAGTLKNIKLRLATILPNCGLRATPHIESKLKTRKKKQYGVIYDMINTIGFGWNNVRKCVDSDEAWHSIINRQKSRSRDPIVRSMDRFTNVMNDAIDKTTDTLDKMCQVLAKSKMNENGVIADDLQKM
ncbi:hypothetical protein LWI28_024345 [Acer negundo]|uniref:Myb/SANT-like domain-containing protein n=1 Tax=Acer negundo TaxID=4023 RepID=A0AAD5P312_ACENE|nr:hypothetical protein LWI28_024345 [Acer negundo]